MREKHFTARKWKGIFDYENHDTSKQHKHVHDWTDPFIGSSWIALAKFSKVRAEFFTVVRWIAIHSVADKLELELVTPSPTCISQSFANEGPSIRTPSSIRRPAAAAAAAPRTVSDPPPFDPDVWPIPPSLRKTVSIISRVRSTIEATTSELAVEWNSKVKLAEK